MYKSASDIFVKGVSVLQNDLSKEQSKVREVFKNILRYPIKVLATFFAAPFLLVRVAWTIKNPVRRIIASLGLLLSALFCYVAGTFLGSLFGALFVATHVGTLAALGLFLGTTVSVYLSVVFMVIVFNSVSFIFLKMSTEDVVNYLKNQSLDANKETSHSQDEQGGELHEMRVQLQANKNSMDEQAEALLNMRAEIVKQNHENAQLKKNALYAITVTLIIGCLAAYLTLAR